MRKELMIHKIEEILTEKMRKENPYVCDVKPIVEEKVDRLVGYLALLAEKIFDGEDPLGIKDGKRRATTGKDEKDT